MNTQKTAEMSNVDVLHQALVEFILSNQMVIKNHLRYSVTTTSAEEGGRYVSKLLYNFSQIQSAQRKTFFDIAFHLIAIHLKYFHINYPKIVVVENSHQILGGKYRNC